MPWQVWTVLLFYHVRVQQTRRHRPSTAPATEAKRVWPHGAFIPTTLSIEIRRLPLSPGGCTRAAWHFILACAHRSVREIQPALRRRTTWPPITAYGHRSSSLPTSRFGMEADGTELKDSRFTSRSGNVQGRFGGPRGRPPKAWWRRATGTEIQIVAYDADGLYPIEVKRSRTIRGADPHGLNGFRVDYPTARCVLLFGGDRGGPADAMRHGGV